MALVLLPCDLPSWLSVQRQLNQIRIAQNSAQLIDAMQKLHGMCCISLDPDENDRSDPKTFIELQNYLDCVLTDEERTTFFKTTLPSLVTYALRLKQYKPYDGLQYSLQQQVDCTELDRRFVASLVANAFFSTFPRRTNKTHPTLQDCNFSKYFVHLKSTFQQKKIHNILCYFEFIAQNEPKGKVMLARQVIPKKSLFSMDDWLACDRPLCPVIIRYDGKIEQAEYGLYQICFSSGKIGGAVLEGSDRQEDLMFCTFPELFMTLLSTEALENNEALTVHGLLPIAHLQGHSEESLKSRNLTVNNHQGFLNTHVCFIDAADFHSSPSVQYEESSILRELNKAFIGFRQQQQPPYMRLPPVGKSCSSTPPENPSPKSENSEVLKDPGLTALTEVYEVVPKKQTSDDHLSLSMMKDLMGQKGGLCNLVNKMLGPSNAVEGSARLPPNGGGASADIKSPEPPYKMKVSEQWRSPVYENIFNQIQRVGDDCLGLEITNVASSSFPMMPSVNSRTPVSTVKFHACDLTPFVKEDSEDSIYRDCDDCLDNCELPASNGLSLQRPLKLTRHRPVMVESSEDICPEPVLSVVTTNMNLQVPASSPLEGASMEASFISCYSHMSSSSSEDEVGKNALEDDDDEEGFVSCAEELEDIREERDLKASRQTLCAVSELPLDFENPWGWRRVLTSVTEGRMQSSTTSDTEMEGRSNLALDLHIAGPDLEDREEFVLRRSASTGFILDEDEDLFMGDGLEHEREWLAQFRHRSTNPSRSISRRNSSRYSFSSDFSSDLEDIYEHFEEKMTEGPVRENPAYTGRLGDRLKRTLSDSLTTFPKLSQGFPRSLSLTEKMQQEKLCLEYAKKIVQEPPVRDISESLEIESCGPDHCASVDFVEEPESNKLKPFQLPGQLVGTRVALEQRLSEIEESVTLPLPATQLCRSHLSRLPSQLSVWWNYNAVYDFYVPLNQFPKASSDKLREEDEERNCGCSLTIAAHPSELQPSMRNSKLDVIAESPDGSSDGPDPIPSLVITDYYQESKPIVQEDCDCSMTHAYHFQMNEKPMSIYRSKSASTTYDMAKTQLEEQHKCTLSWVQEFLSVGGITRSLSAMDVKELLKRGFVGVGDQSFTREKDDLGKIETKQQRQPRLRKWQAACNLSDLEQVGTLHIDGSSLLDSQESERSEQKFGQIENLPDSAERPHNANSNIKLASNVNVPSSQMKHVRQSWASEDLCSRRRMDIILDNQTSFEKLHSRNISKESLAEGRHNLVALHSFSNAPSRKPKNHSWMEFSLSDHLSSNEIHRKSDQLLELALDGEGIKPIATGNWGCGQQGGDPQLKALIQWMAASRANVPFMIYYTGGDQRIVKLNIVCRVLMDRHWSVSHIARAMLQHYKKSMKATAQHPDGDADLLDSLLPKETDL